MSKECNDLPPFLNNSNQKQLGGSEQGAMLWGGGGRGGGVEEGTALLSVWAWAVRWAITWHDGGWKNAPESDGNGPLWGLLLEWGGKYIQAVPGVKGSDYV